MGVNKAPNTSSAANLASSASCSPSARSGFPISFWQFTRKGPVVTAVTVLLAAPYLWLALFRHPVLRPDGEQLATAAADRS
jgi:Na+/H+ antiporter NhaD/arsenite permease-like protein